VPGEVGVEQPSKMAPNDAPKMVSDATWPVFRQIVRLDCRVATVSAIVLVIVRVVVSQGPCRRHRATKAVADSFSAESIWSRRESSPYGEGDVLLSLRRESGSIG
jgi:hypothetical protein